MKKKTAIGRKTKTISIAVPTELLPQMERQAALEGRTLSNFLMLLVVPDIKKLGL